LVLCCDKIHVIDGHSATSRVARIAFADERVRAHAGIPTQRRRKKLLYWKAFQGGSMAKPMTRESAAEIILVTLVHKRNLKPNEASAPGTIKSDWADLGLKSEDLQEGLNYAGEQGWLTRHPATNSFVLTDLGYAAAPEKE
jgi:hypothetical protein